MRRYPRILRRFRNPFRGVRRTGRRRTIRRRLVRNTLNRRIPRPEIKWANVDLDQLIQAGVKYTTALSPTVLARGTGVSNRIGSSVKFRWVKFRLWLDGDSTPNQDGAELETVYRVLIWTPRLDYTQSANYIVNELGILQVPDPNIVTVHKDFYGRVGNLSMKTLTNPNASVTNYALPPGVATKHVHDMRILFPRNARFTSVDDDINVINPDKDVLYVSVFNGDDTGNALQFNAHSHTTYTDS